MSVVDVRLASIESLVDFIGVRGIGNGRCPVFQRLVDIGSLLLLLGGCQRWVVLNGLFNGGSFVFESLLLGSFLIIERFAGLVRRVDSLLTIGKGLVDAVGIFGGVNCVFCIL